MNRKIRVPEISNDVGFVAEMCSAAIPRHSDSTEHIAARLGFGTRRALYVDSPIFRRAAYGAQHPLAISRTESVFDLCRALAWLPQDALVTSHCAPVDTLCQFHDRDYVNALRQSDEAGRVARKDRLRYCFGTMENPLFPGVFERAATAVGGSILAAELALQNKLAFHPAGGTHHGQPGRSSGFCYFNDPVFAIRTLLEADVDRVLYADFDAHHGDGVEAAFCVDQRVSLLSIHEADRWPHTGSHGVPGRICNLPVAKGVSDHAFKRLMHEVVLPFIAQVQPQAVVITCGADCLAGDPLSTMKLTNTTLWWAVEQVCDTTPAAVVLGGGGYNPWTLARCWSGLWARLAGFAIPTSLPESAVQILRSLRSDLIDEDDICSAWISSIEDINIETSAAPPTD